MKNLYEDVGFLDRRCYEFYELSEDLLMEHAASALVEEVRRLHPSKVLIVAGPGNNGGDGVAAARQLLGVCEVELFMPYGAKSDMCKKQLERFYACGGVLSEDIKGADVVIDALFGSGLTRELQEDAIRLIERLNELEGYKIACDIPSGIDKRGNPSPTAFIAHKTITMGAMKLALFGDGAKDYVGKIGVANLGISQELYELESEYKLLERSDFSPPVRRKKAVHKGDFGHLAVVAGQKEGAAVMAALAALRYGAGLVSVVSKRPLALPYELMQATSLPRCDALVVGMGLGESYTQEEFDLLVRSYEKLMVVDADLFYSPRILDLLQRDNIVLTPHPKEFAALLAQTGIAQVEARDIQKDRFGYVQAFMKRYPKVVLLLKGANTIIAHDRALYINPHGSNALAKGGSGDVLSGIIAALLAQGYEPLEAAIQGSLAHAFASQKVEVANYALTPSDLIQALGRL